MDITVCRKIDIQEKNKKEVFQIKKKSISKQTNMNLRQIRLGKYVNKKTRSYE